MDYIIEDILCGEIVPVLLGISPEMSETAHRMYRRYGVVSHVFCNKVPLPMRLSLCMKFHIIRATHDERLLLQALKDFATQLGHADVILYLIPCTMEYTSMLWEHREELEPYYVIADRDELYRVWFDEEAPRLPYAKEENAHEGS